MRLIYGPPEGDHLLSSRYRVFLRHFGILATCYLHSHYTWLHSERLPLLTSWAVNSERFTARRLSYILGIVKLHESSGRAGGLLRRIRLRDAVYGDLHLRYQGGCFRPLEWTYPPDYRTPVSLAFFSQARLRFPPQLKTEFASGKK